MCIQRSWTFPNFNYFSQPRKLVDGPVWVCILHSQSLPCREHPSRWALHVCCTTSGSPSFCDAQLQLCSCSVCSTHWDSLQCRRLGHKLPRQVHEGFHACALQISKESYNASHICHRCCLEISQIKTRSFFYMACTIFEVKLGSKAEFFNWGNSTFLF